METDAQRPRELIKELGSQSYDVSNRGQLTIDALEAKVVEKRGELEILRRQEFRNQDRTLSISADITGLQKRIARASKDADLPTLATLQALGGELTDIKAEAISHIATPAPRIDVEEVQQEARDELLKELIILFESELPPTCAVAVRNLMRDQYGHGIPVD